MQEVDSLKIIADQDLAKARRNGHVIIRETKLGDLDLTYENGAYMIEGEDNRCLLVARASAARDFLIENYELTFT